MLDKSYNRLQELLEKIDDIYFTLDAQLNITYVNNKARQVFDIPDNFQWCGNLWDLLPEVASSFYHPLKDSLAHHQDNEFKGYYPLSDKWFHAHIYPDADGGCAVFFRDITEQKRMEFRLRDRDIYLCTILNHLVDGVIVIDDDANIRDLMERFLTRQGFYVYTAASADEGIALANELKPDVITLDVMMPEKDGWWVLTQLKKNAELKQIPIVMMSLVEDKELGYALGASDYLTKPVDKETLLNTITKYVRIKDKLIAFVIQPDRQSAQSITTTLEENNILTVCFEDNETAYNMLFVFQPDIIVIELHSASGDSMQLMDRIKKNPRWQQIAIFVTTSGEITEEEVAQFQENINDILYNNDQTGDEFLKNLKNQIVGCLRNKN